MDLAKTVARLQQQAAKQDAELLVVLIEHDNTLHVAQHYDYLTLQQGIHGHYNQSEALRQVLEVLEEIHHAPAMASAQGRSAYLKQLFAAIYGLDVADHNVVKDYFYRAIDLAETKMAESNKANH